MKLEENEKLRNRKGKSEKKLKEAELEHKKAGRKKQDMEDKLYDGQVDTHGKKEIAENKAKAEAEAKNNLDAKKEAQTQKYSR